MNGGRVTSSVRAMGGQRFIASFTPHEVGIHTVQITFNGETVPGEYGDNAASMKLFLPREKIVGSGVGAVRERGKYSHLLMLFIPLPSHVTFSSLLCSPCSYLLACDRSSKC